MILIPLSSSDYNYVHVGLLSTVNVIKPVLIQQRVAPVTVEECKFPFQTNTPHNNKNNDIQ